MTYYRAYGTRDLKQAGYKLGVLSQYFHEAALRTIDSPAILGFVAHRRSEGRAAATINVELATLRKALRLAQEHGKLDRVPRIHMLRPAPPRAGFFEPAQFEAVMRGLLPDLALAVQIAYTYGWRVKSEVLTLTRRQVDLDAGTLRLEPGNSKNRDGRLVYLTPELRDGIEAQLARIEALQRTTAKTTPYVFPWLSGVYRGRRIKNFLYTWRRACVQAGCPGMLRHDLRRTAVRNLIQAGVPERVAMKITGHRTRAVFDRYHIVSPDDLRAAVDKLRRHSA
jgi:integrase